jgi:hypothetical protein
MIVVVGVKVWSVMTHGRFGEHPNDDAVKAGDFGHGVRFQGQPSNLISRRKPRNGFGFTRFNNTLLTLHCQGGSVSAFP